MYEPSKELIEQIAKEYRDLMFSEMESSSKEPCWDNLGYFCRLSKDICNLPTIRKALELYENQPKWQDKPDKEGCYAICAKASINSAEWHIIYSIDEPVRLYKVDKDTYVQFEGENDLLYRFLDWLGYFFVKWLYIPEPEPYKGEE
ncbi:hypothetical protein [Dehalococcoides sp. THU4]|uniref:hypothetical protein n=1 Tax=Dehalococcoides sp. THU4 TaxID=3348344 RepID=UPI003719AB58